MGPGPKKVSSMTVVPISGHTKRHHRRLDWAAVGTATLALVMVAAALITLAGVGFNADDEAFDNWKGVVVGVGLFGGVLVSIGACALAVVATVMHERWAWLWFPLLFGPAFILAMPLWFD
jgi:hypothetical protein